MDQLTPGMRRVLTAMAEADARDDHEGAELVCEGLACWVGETRTNRRVVSLLLRYVLIQDVSDVKGIERYVINGTGRSALRRPDILSEIAGALARDGGFTVVDDHLIPMPAGFASA